ncbi:ADM [Lacerta agilis]|uniref:ADM n=1 Tax=Lacerta agilis TaxID=80427 RepID=UPI001419C3E6|nr:ADM [Lacerta agilis]XP_033008523.1 ADM [Lacerta agilis]
MKVVSLALLYLGSVSFFGVEAAELDIASDFKRKWSSWRARRDKPVVLTVGQAAALGEGKRPAVRQPAAQQKPVVLTVGQAAALGEGKRPAGRQAGKQKPALTAAQAAAGVKRPARSLDSLRAKRNQLPNVASDFHLQHLREMCGFGTCTVHNLAHLIHHYMDKDKDVSAPPEKFGPQGYGRRRRRSLLDTVAAAASSSGRSTRTASRLLASLREGGSVRALAQQP